MALAKTRYDQILADHRQGSGSKLQMFGGGSPANGNVALYDSNGNIIPLANGSNGHVLTLSSGVPVWSAAAGGGGSASIAYRTWAQHLTDTVEGISILRDSRYIAVSDGASPAAWEYYLPGFGKVTPPATITSGWSWVNQSTATLDSSSGAFAFTMPFTATNERRMYVRTAPSTPYVITIGVILQAPSLNFHQAGGCWRQSSDGKHISACVYRAGNGHFCEDFAAVTGAPASTNVSTALHNSPASLIEWIRFADDGTNRSMSVSKDRISWVQIYSEGRTTYLTADQVGIISGNGANANTNYPKIVDWTEA